MKAVIFDNFGAPDVLRLQEVPDPAPQPGEVQIAVHAASINGADYQVRSGRGAKPVTLPHILGRDFSGVVTRIGDGVMDLHRGDEVFGVLDIGMEGAYAELLTVKAALVARKPAWLSHVDAAAMALTGLTALWAIEDTVKLQAGETILIHGGAGGVASIGIQLARHIGARVITTARASDHEYVARLGAQQVIDYASEDFTRAAGPCDVVFDPVGGDIQVRSYDVLKPGGRLVRITNPTDGFIPGRADVQTLRPAVTRDRAHLERLVALLGSRAVVPPETHSFKLADAATAHREGEARRLRGKLLLVAA